MSATPPLSAFTRNQIEQRERQMQTAFPAKVLDWHSSTNTVQLEPQFFEVWRDGEERRTETIEAPEDAYIDNVPVLFPRSGTWSITFPIVPESFGLVICTKYSLDVWRNQGNAGDPGDLRRFTMSGAVFHPVNLHPNGSALNEDNGLLDNVVDMVIGQHSQTAQFVALANLVKSRLDTIQQKYDVHVHPYTSPAANTTAPTVLIGALDPVASTTVKASE
jgi:hypothetical protein